MEDYSALLHRSKELSEALAELEPRRNALLVHLNAAQAAHGQARELLRKREESLAEAESRCVDTAPLRAQQAAMQAGLEALVALQHQVEEGLRLKQQEEEEEGRRKKIEGEVSDAALQYERLQAELEALRPRVEQARKDRDQAVAFEELAARRAALRPGEPCVLCGAVEHPWAHRPLEQLSQDLRSEYTSLDRQQQQLQRDLTTQDTLEKQARRLLEPLIQGLSQLRSRRDGLRTKLQAELSAWKAAQNLAELPAAPDLAGRLKAAEEQLRGRLRGVAQQLDQAGQADQAAARARLQRTAAATAVESSRTAEESAQKGVDQATIQWERLRTDQTRVQENLDSIRGSLPEDLQGEDALPLLRRGVAAWRERQATHQSHQAELVRLESQLQTQSRHLAEREQALVQAAEMLELRTHLLAGLRVERAALLEGRPVTAVEKEAREAQKSADEALNLAQNRLAGARAALRAATEALAATRAEEADAVVQHQAADAALQQVLAGRSEGEIRRVLAHDGRWIQESRARIAAWRTREGTARGEKDTCLRLVEEHRQQPPPLDHAAAQQSLAEGPQQRALRQEQIQSI
ncbi:MAG TPA: hypothetical protein PKY30_05785, partial [Myxococcota bacterium]|nr:hypothetical protein [Myxococcota bacterium]